MPKLSVVVPVYNTEKYLKECIDSILGQTFTDFELILVDDGSTDGSGAICDEYAKQDSRIRVVHQKNAGVTRARKIGVALATGEYITFVDSDDWIDAETYSNIVSDIENHNADIGIYAMIVEKIHPQIIINCIGEGVFSKELLQTKVCTTMLFDFSMNRSSIIASLCNKVIKRELLQKAIETIPDDLDYGEDAISGYLCILNSETICICNSPFYHYRDNPSSISHASLSVMGKRIVTLERAMKISFSKYDTDMSKQISGHIARHTVEQVRSVLLYSQEKSFFQRIHTVRAFCQQPTIRLALKNAYPEIRDNKEKVKVLLIRYKLFALLYLLFKRV